MRSQNLLNITQSGIWTRRLLHGGRNLQEFTGIYKNSLAAILHTCRINCDKPTFIADRWRSRNKRAIDRYASSKLIQKQGFAYYSSSMKIELPGARGVSSIASAFVVEAMHYTSFVRALSSFSFAYQRRCTVIFARIPRSRESRDASRGCRSCETLMISVAIRRRPMMEAIALP